MTTEKDWAYNFINPTMKRVFYSEVYRTFNSYSVWIDSCEMLNIKPIFDYVNQKVRWSND